MARNPKHDILFEPVQLGPKTARNRFYQTPYSTGFGTDLPGEEAAFRATRAEGGWAVVSTGFCSIHPESDPAPRVHARLWDEEDIARLSLLCEQVHEHGSLAAVELHFGGVEASGYRTRLAARGVSQLRSGAFWMSSCYAMGKDEIRELQAQYVASATRARAAGFDVVNVHGSELESVPAQFLSPHWNKRTDEYGGSFENRARFWLETLEQVRGAVGDCCAIGARLCLDTLDERHAGLRVEEDGAGFVELADHLVDFWDVQVGGSPLAAWPEDSGPSRYRAEGWQLSWVDQIRPRTAKPIAAVGRFTGADAMAAAVSARRLDLVGSARGSIADPFLPRKIEEGRLDEVRECIGCNVCLSRVTQGAPIICTQNATAGEEYRRGWSPEAFEAPSDTAKDVLVVGGGPAGLECAVVLARRGFRRIHVVDEANEIGGSVRWISQLPGLGEWGRVINYRKIQLDKHRNVELILGTRLEPAEALEYGAEIVVVATGARWAADGLNRVTNEPIPGADLAHCYTPEQVMAGFELPGERVLVYDCDGYFVGVGVAEHLARAGKHVTLVTPLAHAAPYLAFTGERAYVLGTLASMGVCVVAEHFLSAIRPDGVTGAALATPGTAVDWEAHAVVLVTQRIGQDEIYQELASDRERLAEEGIEALYRIGDCVAPRLIADAVFDGQRVGRRIGTATGPAELPAIRE